MNSSFCNFIKLVICVCVYVCTYAQMCTHRCQHAQSMYVGLGTILRSWFSPSFVDSGGESSMAILPVLPWDFCCKEMALAPS